MTNETPPAEPQEKKPIWLILFTVICFAVMAALIAAPFVYKAPDAESYPDIVRFVGRFHFILLHLPIGFLTLVAIMEGINLMPFVKRKFETSFMLFAASAASVLAIVAGFLLMRGDGSTGELMDDHMWGGIAFGCVVIAAMLLKMWARRGGAFRIFAPLCIYLACGVMGWAAHQGGALVHGSTYLTKYAPDWVPDPIYAALGDGSPRPEPPTEQELAAAAIISTDKLTPAQLPVFEHVIHPILDAKCLYCHNQDKTRGKLRMDSVELMLVGGTSGPSLVPGDSDASLIMQRIHLPLDDEDEEHMPPSNKEQLENHEVKILEWWVNAGTPIDESIANLDAPQDIINSANLLLSPEEKAALEKKQAEEKAAAAAAAEKRKADIASSLAEIQATYPGALNYVARGSADMTFTAVSLRDKFTDNDLAKLLGVADAISALDIGATSVSDDGMASIAAMKNLKSLKLSETAVTDDSISTLAQLPMLESLNLYGTQVTDSGIMGLKPLKNLSRLFLWNSQVTDDGANALRQEMPQTDVLMGIK